MHTVCDIDPEEPVNISILLAFEFTQEAWESVRLNDAALENMLSIITTLDTSHFEMSPLKLVASENMRLMSATLDTSHFDRSPFNE